VSTAYVPRLAVVGFTLDGVDDAKEVDENDVVQSFMVLGGGADGNRGRSVDGDGDGGDAVFGTTGTLHIFAAALRILFSLEPLDKPLPPWRERAAASACGLMPSSSVLAAAARPPAPSRRGSKKRAEESAVGAMSKKQRLEQTDEH
jgi:hypothetical protein